MDEIRDDEIIVDAKTGFDSMKTTHTRYYTLSAPVALSIIILISVAAWAGIFFMGAGFGRSLCS